MKLKKVAQVMMLSLPMFMLAACSSSNKNNNDDQFANGGMESGTLYGNGSGNDINSLSDQARMQLQDLQRDNIVYFGFDQYDVSQNYMQTLDAHANFLRENPSFRVVLEGHTDERGTAEYNIALGERRANAVRLYLQGRGVGDEQMQIVSYGKEKPAVLGSDESAFAKNRRVVLVY